MYSTKQEFLIGSESVEKCLYIVIHVMLSDRWNNLGP